MSYSQNLKNEKKPSRKVLLPAGPRTFEVVGVEYGTSKSNNPQFIFDIKDDLTSHVDKFYAIDVEGKRGNLKMMLEACEVKSDEDGNFNWDNPDVIAKKIVCEVVHEPNTYINRDGETVTSTQHRIADIKPLAWKE